MAEHIATAAPTGDPVEADQVERALYFWHRPDDAEEQILATVRDQPKYLFRAIIRGTPARLAMLTMPIELLTMPPRTSMRTAPAAPDGSARHQAVNRGTSASLPTS